MNSLTKKLLALGVAIIAIATGLVFITRSTKSNKTDISINNSDSENNINEDDNTENDTDNNIFNEYLAYLETTNSTQAPTPIPSTDYAQIDDDSLIPFYNGQGLMGYKDNQENVLIEAQFENAGMFYSDFAPVQYNANEKIGFINKEGTLIKEPFFDYIESVDIESGTMVAINGTNYGLLDLEGNVIKPFEFNTAEELFL